MTTTTRKPQVSPVLVARMVKFYGSVEAAREAYKAERAGVRAARATGGRNASLTLWVTGSGRIARVDGNEIFYRGSADAPSALPS